MRFDAAVSTDLLFSETAARLSEFPQSGRAGKIAGTREILPHVSYRMIYALAADAIWILALVHTTRMWPPVGE